MTCVTLCIVVEKMLSSTLRAAGVQSEKVRKKLQRKAQLMSGDAVLVAGAEPGSVLTNGDVRKKTKKKQKQENGQLARVAAIELHGGAANHLPADAAAKDRKAAKKEKRAKSKAAARALAAAQTSAVAVDAPVAGGNVGAEGAADAPRPSKKAKVAKGGLTSAAMAAVGSKELAALGADLPI